MVKLVAVTPSASVSTSVHETIREVVDVEKRATDSTTVERTVKDDSQSNKIAASGNSMNIMMAVYIHQTYIQYR